MTGATLYVKKNGCVAVGKLAHDGYTLEDFAKSMKKKIKKRTFNKGPKDVVEDFYKFFDNTYGKGSIVEMFLDVLSIKEPIFEAQTIETTIEKIDEFMTQSLQAFEKTCNKEYVGILCCGYYDYMVLIDLDNKTIQGLPEDEKQLSEEEQQKFLENHLRDNQTVIIQNAARQFCETEKECHDIFGTPPSVTESFSEDDIKFFMDMPNFKYFFRTVVWLSLKRNKLPTLPYVIRRCVVEGDIKYFKDQGKDVSVWSEYIDKDASWFFERGM